MSVDPWELLNDAYWLLNYNTVTLETHDQVMRRILLALKQHRKKPCERLQLAERICALGVGHNGACADDPEAASASVRGKYSR